MSDEIKHECAVALLRLLEAPASAEGSGGAAPRSLPAPGGTLLSLLLEKQHNRGQDGAGAAILSLSPEPGKPAWWIRKSASATALADLLGAIGRRSTVSGESLFLGHLRYATYGRGDESFCHPFVHAEPRLDRTLFLAGNFNLTNTHELFEEFRAEGNHPGSTADGYLICELIAQELSQCSQGTIVHHCPQITNPNPGALGERAIPKQTPRTPRTPRENETPRTPRENETPRTSRTPRENETPRTPRENETPQTPRENQTPRTPRTPRENETPRTSREDEPPILRALRVVLPKLDGAFTLCGMTGDGWAFAVRDAHGIRPGWYLAPPASPHAVAVASERPAIQAAFDVPPEAVRELPPGVALLVSPAGEMRFEPILSPALPRPCVFEHIYFSRANDADIHRERKALGAALVPQILEAAQAPLEDIFFSYIPNSAQVAFHGLLEALWTEGLAEGRPVRFGQVAVKDAKFRTFIADAAARREIGKHVYDVTYGLVRPGVDTLVVLDDSIVRGTTMREAILPMLDRLGPRRIVVASSAPPIRYPDCYGIDMSTLGELVAFRALENLLGDKAEAALHAAMEEMSHAEFAKFESHAEFAEFESHAEFAESTEFKSHAEFAEFESHAEFAESAEFESHAENAETSSFAAKRHPSFAPQAHPSFAAERHPSFGNPLACLYARFTEEQHAAEIARLLTPPGMRAQVSVVYQTVPALRAAVASHKSQVASLSCDAAEGGMRPLTCDSCSGGAAIGDWYFTGDYPTPGGYRVLRRSLENHLARREGRSY